MTTVQGQPQQPIEDIVLNGKIDQLEVALKRTTNLAQLKLALMSTFTLDPNMKPEKYEKMEMILRAIKNHHDAPTDLMSMKLTERDTLMKFLSDINADQKTMMKVNTMNLTDPSNDDTNQKKRRPR